MLRLLPLTFILAGCQTVVAPFTVDSEFLQTCETPPPLEGMTGADIMTWAKDAGPGIAECIRIHNGLVTIIKAQQE